MFWYEFDYIDFCVLKFGGVFINLLIIVLILIVLILVIGCMVVYVLVCFCFMGCDMVLFIILMVCMVLLVVLLVFVFGLWNNEFCIGKMIWLGLFICESLGGCGDVCLVGIYLGIILVYVVMNLFFVIWIL